MIKPEAFLALEASLSKRLTDAYTALTSRLFKQVHEAIDQKRFTDAITLVNSFTLQPLFDQEKDYIKYITNLAMLFGASRVTPRAHTTVVGLGGEQDTKDMLLQWFEQMINVKGEAYLKNQAMQLVADARDAHAPDTIHKGDLRSRVRAFLAERGLVKKAEGDQPDQRIALPFASFMDSSGQAYFNMASSLHTSRVSAYGFTAEAQALGLDQYQIDEQLDRRTCPVCRIMHGKVFDVSAARGLLDVATRTTDPDQLTAMMPWPRQDKQSLAELEGMSDDEIIANGWQTPPYHPYCRGLLVKVGNAPETPDTTQPDQYTATQEDFQALGQDVSQDTVDTWNSIVGIAPAAVVSQLRGMSVDEYLTNLQSGTIESGVDSISTIGEGDALNISLDGLAFGSSSPILQDYNISGSTLTIGTIELDAADADLARDALRSVFLTANDIGVDTIELTAGLDTGGYAWAKYGFVPNDISWATVKDQIQANAAELTMPDEETQALTALLASDDPKSIWTIADLPDGERLLYDTEWTGTLDLNDQEAVDRFRAYIGE